MTSRRMALPALPWQNVEDIGPFVAGALLLGVATRGVVPRLVQHGWEPLVAWFAAGAALVFAPTIAMGLGVLAAEGERPTRARLRLHPLERRDWAFVAVGALAVALASGLLATAARGLGAELAPPFLRVEPLGPGRWWILGAWLPFWALNVLAEELTWRAVLLPRHEARFGRSAWLVQALAWTTFHVPFGPTVVMLAAPTLVVVPWVAQRTGNTWAGVIVHALANGPPFVLIALGVL